MRALLTTVVLAVVLAAPALGATRDTFVAFGADSTLAASHVAPGVSVIDTGQADFPHVVVIRIRCGDSSARFYTCAPGLLVPDTPFSASPGYPSLGAAIEPYYQATMTLRQRYAGVWLATFADGVTVIVYRRK